jgi:hypothetical protein
VDWTGAARVRIGVLEIHRPDGKAKPSFENRPYVIMNDHAFGISAPGVELGSCRGQDQPDQKNTSP